MPLAWKENLSVKNDVIDSDHKYLIELINEIERVIKIKDPEALNASVDRLKEYATYHFAREEKISRLVAYEHADHLQHVHVGLLEQLDERRDELMSMGSEWSDVVITDFVKFVMDWLVTHVIKEDLLMKKTLQRYPSDFNPFSESQLKAGMGANKSRG